MLDLCKLIFGTVIDLLRSPATLEAEVVVLRQQINVLRRASPNRRPFGAIDRLILGGVCRLFPKSYDALAIVRPDTVIRWHRAGFRLYWRWKSRRRCGPSLAGMEDVPSQPCGWHCRNGPLRRADHLVPAALWFADHGPWPAADPVVWGDRAPDGRMDRQSAH